jgi:DNA replication protein DnaC
MTGRQMSAGETRAAWHARQDEYFRKTVPLDFADALADNPGVVAWCDAYIEACKQRTPPPAQWSLVLLGPVGAGKTWQAYGAIRRIVTVGEIRLTWRAATLADLLEQLRPRPGVDSWDEYERWADADLLLVDDLGADKPTDWAETTLYRLVNHRCERRLPTIWTTNLPKQPGTDDRCPPPTLRSELSERVFSRLAPSRFAAIKGEDRRAARPATP